jgi:hypothetical protein
MRPNIVLRPIALGAGPCPETKDISMIFEARGNVYQIELTPTQAARLIGDLRFSLNSIDGGEYSWAGLSGPTFELEEDCLGPKGGAK